jgi:DNA-binding transcriptional LysR family regulator
VFCSPIAVYAPLWTAAQVLSIRQSTLSRCVRLLEHLFGAVLVTPHSPKPGVTPGRPIRRVAVDAVIKLAGRQVNRFTQATFGALGNGTESKRKST